MMDINPLLRDHVTSAAFVLSLGKTHVAALVRLDMELAYEMILDSRKVSDEGHRRLHRHDVPGLNGLIARGLVVHTFNEAKYGIGGTHRDEWISGVTNGTWQRSKSYAITRAGRLVCDLLKEAGLYQEYAGPLLPLIEAERDRRRAA